MNDLELEEIMAEITKLYPEAKYSDDEKRLYRAEFRKHDRDQAINLIRESRLTNRFSKPDLPAIFQTLRGHTATVRHQQKQTERRRSTGPIEALRNSYRKMYGPKCDNFDDVEFVLNHGRALRRAYPSTSRADIERDISNLLRDVPGFVTYRGEGRTVEMDDELTRQAAAVCFTDDPAAFQSEVRDWQAFANAQGKVVEL